MVYRHHLLIMVAAIAAGLLLGCSGGRHSAVSPGISSPVDLVRADLAKYEVPDGVDPDVFQMLADKLVEEVEAVQSGRTPSQGSPATPLLRLVVTDVGGGITNIAWRYYLMGDYDLNGEVGVADVTPIALHFNTSVTDGVQDNVQSFIDGDGDLFVGVSDITPIALNYQARYNVLFGIYSSAASPTWPLSQWEGSALYFNYGAFDTSIPGTVELSINKTTSDSHYGWCSVDIDTAGAGIFSGNYFFGVRDANEPPDFASSAAFTLAGADAPNIGSVTPTGGQPNSSVQFTVNLLAGTAPLTYSWDFGGGATPDTSTDESPTVTLSSTSGVYDASVTVTNAFGSDTFDWQLGVGNLPDITGVSPTNGQTGENVTFTATVTGDAPLVYSWDFGGGASPNTSSAESPNVTLSATEGEYSANLTVTNAFGSDSFDFTLTVGAAPAPPEITGVSPTAGQEGTQLTLNATVTGTPPFTYAWDFGGGATPNISSAASPTVTLGAEGNYDASLTVTNALGEDTFDFQLICTGPPGAWVKEFVEGPGTSKIGTHCSLVFLPNGTPVIAYQNEPNTDLMQAVKTGPWNKTVVDNGGSGYAGSNAFITLNSASMPVIVYKYLASDFAGSLKKAEWNGSSWDFQILMNGNGALNESYGSDASIAFASNGNAFAANVNGSAPNQHYVIRYNGSSWGSPEDMPDYRATATSCTFDSSNNPIVVCYDSTDKWDLLDPPGTPVPINQLNCYRWTGSSWTRTNIYTKPAAESNSAKYITVLVNPSGNPVVCYFLTGTFEIWYAEYTGTAWSKILVATSGSSSAKNVNMTLSPSGIPTIAFYNAPTQSLKLAVKNGGSFTISDIDDGAGGTIQVGTYPSIKFSPTTGKPSVAYFQGERNMYGLKYAWQS
ncbi:MAG: PKD domain-containing protein [bacterium]|jgi:PKD repeat protein